MKIHPNTHKGAPLQDAIDDYAEAWASRTKDEPSQLWRVRLHMAAALDVSEQSLHEKDTIYFIRRMGGNYLARKVRGIGELTAQRLCFWADGFQSIDNKPR